MHARERLTSACPKFSPSLPFVFVGEVALFAWRSSMMGGDPALHARRDRENHFVRVLISK
jgi:hypothetical protein